MKRKITRVNSLFFQRKKSINTRTYTENYFLVGGGERGKIGSQENSIQIFAFVIFFITDV